MTTPTVQITANGVFAPDFATVQSWAQDQYRSIFGSDVYIEPDSQDGQWIAVIASCINDCNQAAIGVYNQFSPSTSQGTGLSSVVKINGLKRLVASFSTADVRIVGQAGTLIIDGQIGDNQQLETRWKLPASVTIPPSGSIIVTATCIEQGEVTAQAGTLTAILTPTRGWQSVSNPDAATPGAPVERDAQLRQRQSVSTSLPAVSPVATIRGIIANLPGVQRLEVYENDHGAPDANGLPGHSISVVVKGGDAAEICKAIALKKTPGTGTYGDISEVIVDPDRGVPVPISFFNLIDVPIKIAVTIKALNGYVSTTGAQLIADVVDWVNALPIGEDVYWSKIFGPAGLNNIPLGNTFNVTAIAISRDSNAPGMADVPISFREAAACTAEDVTLTVTS
ncbi:MAG: hypothetical protein E6Q98_16100 [Rhodospirillaceae bacterium]|nr:MAG: hypothetical protein E6Q98_16100 [Rhodospirillaceae bacterium]